ncbi:hypothetical protein AOQ84DRAFT_391451 [Glonium stellatum]|uniref:Uncharacterized protein n=1 Tax=Glonium stellatum TaxID=574774 RepID=A0A8E2JPA7_9PEZI|nr:hypothetical protein AOQ84DRAFT_391451 [Glonium stellatum]
MASCTPGPGSNCTPTAGSTISSIPQSSSVPGAYNPSSSSIISTSSPSSTSSSFRDIISSSAALPSSPTNTITFASTSSSSVPLYISGRTSSSSTIFGETSSVPSQLSSATGTPQTAGNTTVPDNSNVSHSNKVAAGAVVGIAITTAIIGAAIAFILAFFLFSHRRKDSRRSRTKHFSFGPSARPLEMNRLPPNTFTKPDLDLTDLTGSSDFLSSIITQTADDKTVKEKTAVLFDQVQLHVENFYRDVHVSIMPGMESSLLRFGSPTALPESLITLLNSSPRSTILIKHCLMSYILGVTSPFTAGSERSSLLPPEISSVACRVSRDGNKIAKINGYIIWKMLTVHLNNELNSGSDKRSHNIATLRDAARKFSQPFSPWVNPKYGDGEREEHLVQVLNNAINLSVWLFGQPFLYDFSWDRQGSGLKGGVMITPGLMKMTNHKGVVTARPQVLLDATIAQA